MNRPVVTVCELAQNPDMKPRKPLGPDEVRIRRAYGMTIRVLRERLGIAQEKLALEAGKDRAHMSNLERGTHTPTLATVLHFLPYLKVTFPEFAVEFDKCLRRARREIKKNGTVD